MRGSGQAAALPDRAEVTVRVEGEATAREQAYARAAAASSSIDHVLAGFADALGRITTTGLSVVPRRQQRKGESVTTGWIASRVTTIEVIDFTRLNDLLRELAAAGATITRLAWSLDLDNDVYSVARGRAVADARRRTDDYARSLGVTMGDVLWLAEPGLRDARGAALSPSRVLRRHRVSRRGPGDRRAA